MTVHTALAITLIETGTLYAQTAAVESLLVARWQAGQSWRVEYLRSAPSPAQAPAPPLRPPERTVWRYQVMSVEAQQVRVEAVEEGDHGKFDLWFSAPLLNLGRAVKIVDNRNIDVIVHPGRTPYFGWSPAYPLIFDWPDLPQSRKTVNREFTDDDGQHVAESVRFRSGSQFEVAMTVRRRVDAGYTETRRSVQTWVVGSPWWSEASIRTESLIDGKKSEGINIQGRLLP